MTEINPATGIIYLEPERSLLICRVCQVGIGPANVSDHLSKHHSNLLSCADRRVLTSSLSISAALHPKDLPGIAAAQAKGYHPDIRTYSHGLACAMPGCLFHCREYSTMRRKHFVSAHPKTLGPLTTQIRPDVYVSTLFSHTHIQYYPVNPPSRTMPDLSTPTATLLQQKLTQLVAHNQELAIQLATPPPCPSAQTTSLWDQRTKWPWHFSGHCMTTLTNPLSLSLPADPPSYQILLLPAITKLLSDCQLQGQQHGVHVLRIFRSLRTDDLSPKPLRFVDPLTLTKYSLLWKQYILFLVRSHGTTYSTNPLQINAEYQGAVSALVTVLSESAGTDNPTHISRLQPPLLALSLITLHETVAASPFLSPFIHFLGLLGWCRTRQTWLSAFDFSPRLSHAVYIFRLLGLHHALPLDKVAHLTDHVHTAREYHRQYLQDGSVTAFTELISLRAYAKVICSKYYVHPSILWSNDMTFLCYKGDLLLLPQLRTWCHKLIQESNTLLCDHLIFQPTEFLAQRDPSLFTDDMTWGTNGENFTNMTSNNLAHGAQRVAGWAELSPNGRPLFGAGTGTRIFDSPGSSTLPLDNSIEVHCFTFLLNMVAYIHSALRT